MTENKQETSNPTRVMVVSKDGSEISDDELEQIAGGVAKRYSKTIDIAIRKTDVDDGF